MQYDNGITQELEAYYVTCGRVSVGQSELDE
jgi:hypothetical protein